MVTLGGLLAALFAMLPNIGAVLREKRLAPGEFEPLQLQL